ncbi:unnamed protein product [Vitrella brassicaformis CCMP3155]|uniref:Amino acid transporter transmembrane domain-containing protein n=2 Tax=Vitrella brassicaformis TaxID=1169539 RepID=A0A0G4E8N4_VITBC|nr:unnamed protein product [Vitrella brassicaformis CCMP3155]|mmetsp:Transcript_5303/g.12519  ORF Transcript_5303/g.12519 Transcript_5303/m.12519 type:complete len:590 (+) Transcript_5303:172-1941(+)|eukprot:CEL92195.1 unnamed protein product [Vitrella brassicaformis CCMP3155]
MEDLRAKDQLWAQSPAGDMVRDVIRTLQESDPEVPSSIQSLQPELKRVDSDPSMPTGVANGITGDPEQRQSSSQIAQPGGFRRQYLVHRRRGGFGRHRSYPPLVEKITDPFLYTRFQLMADDEADSDEADEESLSPESDRGRRRRSARGRGVRPLQPLPPELEGYVELAESAEAEKGKRANTRQTVITILKSFVCSAFLFLPRGFYNGGLLFSLLTMACSWIFSVHCMIRLIKCARPGRESYGDIGEAALGVVGRVFVEISVVVSQMGFSTVLIILFCTTVQDFLNTIGRCDPSYYVGLGMLVALQFPLQAPMAWVRRIKYFGPAMLAADFFLVFGMLIIFGFVIGRLSAFGVRPVHLINTKSWPLFVGTAVYMWEGVGLILPIRSSMKEHLKPKFPMILFFSLLGVLVVYSLFCSFSYLAYGSDIRDVITVNLPNTPAVYAVQIMMALAVFLTTPLQLFPAAKIVEHWLFGIGGRVTLLRKWKKNLVRTVMIAICLAVGYYGRPELDNFVALVGAVCCVPLIFIYPCLFHLILERQTVSLVGSATDLFMVILGFVMMGFTAWQAIATWHPTGNFSRCSEMFDVPHATS